MSDEKTLGDMYRMNVFDTVVAKKYLSLLRDEAYNRVTRLNKTKVYTKEELELIDKIQEEKQVNKDKIDINYSSSLQKKRALTNEISNKIDDLIRLSKIYSKHAEEETRILEEQLVELEKETNPYTKRNEEISRIFRIPPEARREQAEAQEHFEKTNPVAAAQASRYGPILSGVLNKGKAVWRTKTRSRKSRKPKTRKSRKNRTV